MAIRSRLRGETGALVQANYGGVLRIDGVPVGERLGRYDFRSVVDGPNDVFSRHVLPADVVQVAVVRLPHHGVHRPHVLVAGPVEGPGHRSVHGRAHVERVREHDGRLDRAQLPHLQKARGLAEAVAHVHRRRHLLAEEVAPVRVNRRYAGAHRVALHPRAVAHLHARHIGDRVEAPRRKEPGGDPEVP
nr:hypothetical protein [Salinibacter ruber]